MKCPKCGYNSFEIHDTCKKCANDLTTYKNIHGLKPIVLPQETRAAMAEQLIADAGQETPAAVADVPADMFSFDLPENGASGGQPAPQDDPFNFHDEPAAAAPPVDEYAFGEEQKSAQAKAEEEAFADLLETAPRVAPPAAATPPVSSGLESFSWDDTPDPTPGGETVAVNPSDDFNDLFGETDTPSKS